MEARLKRINAHEDDLRLWGEEREWQGGYKQQDVETRPGFFNRDIMRRQSLTSCI